MQVMMTIHESPRDLAKREGSAGEAYWRLWKSYSASVNDHVVGGNLLTGDRGRVTVAKPDGSLTVQEGPHSAAAEQLGGYFIFEVPDMDAAIELASTCPAIDDGRVELYPVASME